MFIVKLVRNGKYWGNAQWVYDRCNARRMTIDDARFIVRLYGGTIEAA